MDTINPYDQPGPDSGTETATRIAGAAGVAGGLVKGTPPGETKKKTFFPHPQRPSASTVLLSSSASQ